MLLRRGPSNIPGLVMPVVVPAIKGKAFRARAHHIAEFLESGEAELDATPPVVGKAGIIRILAALFRGVEYLVNGIVASTVLGG